jgi:hypothetical protein
MNGPILPIASLSIHVLPEWFLVLALFLPRIALLAGWYEGILTPFHLDMVVSPILGLLLPRVLVLGLIYLDQGVDQWFFAHAAAAVVVFMWFHRPKAEPHGTDIEEMRMTRRRPGRVPEWRW